jgi:O-antigen/teichoic acid export membrane protein
MIPQSTKASCPGHEPAATLDRLTGGRLLARNTLLNLIGRAGPLVIAIFAIPILIKELGTDRFGVFTLVGMVIGYFSLFDFGLGRALTKFVAERLCSEQQEGIPVLVWTSLLLMFALGLAGSILIALITPWLVRGVLNIPAGLHAETIWIFYLLALCIPIVITTVGLRGVLEATQRFGFINAMGMVMGGFTFLVPVLILLFSKSLLLIVAVLATARFVALELHLIFCLYAMPALRRNVSVRFAVVAPLLRFGGWITVSNIVSPIMANLDRFLVAALVSVTGVAYYAAPFSVVTNLLVVPLAIAGVLFPAFAASFAQDRRRTVLLYIRGIKYVFLSLFPIVLLFVVFARQGLYLWLGKDFAEHSGRVMQMLTIGLFFNSLAQIPFHLIQSTGKANLTARLHLVELPFYLVAVWWMTRTFGIEGTAIVWSARAMVDALVLFRLARCTLPQGGFWFHYAELPMILALLVFVFGAIPRGLGANIGFAASAMVAFVFASWRLVLDKTEHSIIRAFLKRSFHLVEGT